MIKLIKYFMRIGTALSILINVILGGSSNQTLSARNYDRLKRNKPNLVWLIDSVFFYEEDHCMHSWTYWTLRKDKNYDNYIWASEMRVVQESKISS